MKDFVEAKTTSGFKKWLDELMENISAGMQGFGWNSHLRKFLNCCSLEVKKTYWEKFQPTHGHCCAPVHLLLATVEGNPVLDVLDAGYSLLLLTDHGGWNGHVKEETAQDLRVKEAMWEKGLGIRKTFFFFFFTWGCWIEEGQQLSI